MSINHLRDILLDYAGIGWTVTGKPIGIYYLSYIETATKEQLINLALEWNIINKE